jgi:hypothetical protein
MVMRVSFHPEGILVRQLYEDGTPMRRKTA